jgi:hypothetical protein
VLDFKSKNEIIIYTTARFLQIHLELDFLLNEVFLGINISLNIADALSYRTIIYMEHDIDTQLAEQLKSENRRLILAHLGDETGSKIRDAYEIADVVLRNYYIETIFHNPRWSSKIYWLPNGYRNGLTKQNGKKLRPSHERKQFARFIGWLNNSKSVNNERNDLLNIANSTPLLNIIPTAGFNQGFSAHLYQHLMEDSIFAPCPAGNAAETIRLFDAMETGCIPVTCRHSFLASPAALSSAPFIFISSWSELPETLESLRTSLTAETLNSMQTQVSRYWQGVKNVSIGTVIKALL